MGASIGKQRGRTEDSIWDKGGTESSRLLRCKAAVAEDRCIQAAFTWIDSLMQATHTYTHTHRVITWNDVKCMQTRFGVYFCWIQSHFWSISFWNASFSVSQIGTFSCNILCPKSGSGMMMWAVCFSAMPNVSLAHKRQDAICLIVVRDMETREWNQLMFFSDGWVVIVRGEGGNVISVTTLGIGPFTVLICPFW